MPNWGGAQVSTDLLTAVDLSEPVLTQNVKTTLNDLFATITKNIADLSLQFQDGAAATVSAANQGKLRYLDATPAFQVSLNTAAYVNLITGSGASGRVAYWTGTATVSSDTAFLWDDVNNRLQLGLASSVTGQLRFAASGDANVTTIQSGDTPASDVLIKLPADDPIAGDFLKVTSFVAGTAVLEWSTSGIAGVTGSGVAGQVAFWDTASSIAGDTSFTFNAATDTLTLGLASSLTGKLTFAVSGDANITTIQAGDAPASDVVYKWPADDPAANEILAITSFGGGIAVLNWSSVAGVGGTTGTGVAGQVTFWTGTSTLGGDTAFLWDSGANRLQLGLSSSITGQLRFAVSGDANATTIQGGDAPASDVLYKWPADDPVASDVLAVTSFGGGTAVLEWTPISSLVPPGVTGTGVANQVAYWTGPSTISGDANFLWNPATQFLTIAPATVIITQDAQTGIPEKVLNLVGGAHTSVSSGQDVQDVIFDLSRTITWNTGAVPTNRTLQIQAPTLAFAGASTVAQAVTLSVNSPSAGANATLTESIVARFAPSNAAHVGLLIDYQITATGDALKMRINGNDVIRFDGQGTTFNAVFGSAALAAAATDGFVYLPFIASSSEPVGTPTAYTGMAPIVLENDTNLGEYRLWGYLNGAWRNLGSGPAGPDGAVQYNNGGVFGGEAALTWDDTNDRLGIGTASPSFPVHVVQNITGTRAKILALQNTGASGRTWVLISHATGTGFGDGSFGIYDEDSSAVRFHIGATGNTTITKNGNEAIDHPLAVFDANSGANPAMLHLGNNASGGSSGWDLQIGATGANIGANGFAIVETAATRYTIAISSGGFIAMNTSAYSAVSRLVLLGENEKEAMFTSRRNSVTDFCGIRMEDNNGGSPIEKWAMTVTGSDGGYGEADALAFYSENDTSKTRLYLRVNGNSYFGNGPVNAAPITATINGTGGSGTDIAGGTIQIAGGQATGNAASGSVKLQTSIVGASSTALQSLVDRYIVNGTRKTLTDALTNLFEVALPTLKGCMGTIKFEIFAADATDVQVRRGLVQYSAINKGGVYSTEIIVVNEGVSASTGTLTATWAITGGANKVTISVTPAGSLTETTYYIIYTLENNSEQAITIL